MLLLLSRNKCGEHVSAQPKDFKTEEPGALPRRLTIESSRSHRPRMILIGARSLSPWVAHF